MNSVINRCCNSFSLTLKAFQYISVRHRYYAEKIAKGPIIKDFGYKEKIFREGVLPRLKDAEKLPMPDYRPKNSWCEERAMFGQNDYIDILGGGKIHPVQVSYNVPFWLRGVKGNEMQLLLLKKNKLCGGRYQYEHPIAWEKLNKRIRYLYKFLNRKTKTGFMKD